VSQQQTQNSAEPNQRNYVGQFYGPIPIPAETVAMRLKQHYGFVSDIDVAAAHNSGQGNAGWSASAISEGTSWEAQPGNYYRMSRNWAENDRLTLDVRGTVKRALLQQPIYLPIRSILKNLDITFVEADPGCR
jgi:hypothetical protein